MSCPNISVFIFLLFQTKQQLSQMKAAICLAVPVNPKVHKRKQHISSSVRSILKDTVLFHSVLIYQFKIFSHAHFRIWTSMEAIL